MIEITLVDVCLSDFFCGSPHTTLAIPVDGATTIADIKQQLVEEFRQTDEDTLPGVDEATFKAAIDTMVGDHADTELFDSRLEKFTSREDAPTVFAYFVAKEQ